MSIYSDYYYVSWFKEENLIAANNVWLVVGQCTGTGVGNGMAVVWARCSYSSGLEAFNLILVLVYKTTFNWLLHNIRECSSPKICLFFMDSLLLYTRTVILMLIKL